VHWDWASQQLGSEFIPSLDEGYLMFNANGLSRDIQLASNVQVICTNNKLIATLLEVKLSLQSGSCGEFTILPR